MKVQVLYCYPMVQQRKYYPLAIRFAQTYQQFPAGYDHRLVILCNGSAASDTQMRMFEHIPHDTQVHSNLGWDIGGYQRAADISEEDLLVCLGAHSNFHRKDWLLKMVSAVLDYGPGLYGCSAFLVPNWHVRTTTFWCPPELLRSYPDYVGSSKRSRYEFEHGPTSFTRHVIKLGFACVMVTWKGCYPFDDWTDHAPTYLDTLVRDQFDHDPTSRMDR